MRWAYCLSVYVCLCSCAGSAISARVSSDIARGDYRSALSRYEQDRSRAVLRTLSESVLMQAARSPEPAQRRAAFIELSMLGTRAADLLDELSQPGESLPVRAEALRLRTQLGDDSARRELRSLAEHADPEVADSAVQALSPEHDAELLARALRSPRPDRRSAALAVLGRAAPAHRDVLIEASRFDPTPQLRVAALHALERHGAAAADALEAATHDPDEQVRAAALSAWARVAPEHAEPALDRQLGAAVSEHSISAAIALLSMKPPHHPARARAAISAALHSPDVTLRARAATALQRLPASERDLAGVRARLRVEKADTVRLALALLLGPEDSAARSTLTELSALFTLPGAEAAAELAADSGSARARLHGFLAHDSALVRITAARLIASKLRDPAPIAQLLADTSWQVRGAAAGAVLNVL